MVNLETNNAPQSPVETAAVEAVFQLGEAAQAAHDRHRAHIGKLLEQMGCEVVDPVLPAQE